VFKSIFSFIFFLVAFSYWVIKSISLSSYSCYYFFHINGKWVKKWITKYAIFTIFWKLVTPSLKSEISSQKWCFLSLNPTNKTKFIYSSFYSNLNFEKFLILNILLQFELWMYFQCLLNSIYRMTQKFNVYHDAHHYNVHAWLNFCIFWNKFRFDMIFLHFIFKNSQKEQFSTKKSKKNCGVKRTCNFISKK